MPSTKVQCQFCNQMFSKRSHLYRHWTLNRCSGNPNPLHNRVRCSHCNGEFASEPNLRLHITRNRCPVYRQQVPQATPPPLPTPQQQGAQQQQKPQQSPQLLSMAHPQRIEWLNECMKDNEKLSQSLVQVVWTIINAGPIHLPAVVGGNDTEDEVA